MIRHTLPLLLAALIGCSSKPTSETLADEAVAQSRWDVAYSHLVDAGSEPRILGKRALAALEAGKIKNAIQDWTRLANMDSARSGEAAAGIARAALEAANSDDQLALTDALLALREVAPEWPAGRVALSLRIESGALLARAGELVPAILAATPSRDVADDALYALARSRQESGDCGGAEPLFRSVIFRGDSGISSHSRRALGDCRLGAGLLAAAAGDTLAAVTALNEAVDSDPNGPAGRRALVVLGDVQHQRGEYFAARLSWQTVVTATAVTDSITEMAIERLAEGDANATTGVPW